MKAAGCWERLHPSVRVHQRNPWSLNRAVERAHIVQHKTGLHTLATLGQTLHRTMTLPAAPEPSAEEFARLNRELQDKTELVQSVRKELILSQITVLELQDTVLQKETDKADAVALLGQAELVLEGKINYIFELDRLLNEQIKELQRASADARAAHETITADLVQKLDQANRDLGATHALAGNYAREASEAREKLTALEVAAQQLRVAHSETQSNLATVRAELEGSRLQLSNTTAAKLALEHELAAIHNSRVWKLTAPFRPKP